MFWYIVICVLMLYPLSIVYAGNLSGKKTQWFALVIACTTLWFFMALRNESVGVDTKYYCHVFTQFADIPISEVFSATTYATDLKTWSFDFEPGYRLLNKLVSLVCPSAQTIIVFNSFLIMLLLYRLIRNHSPDYMMSIWLYITLGVYQTEMNVTRNAIAILLVYNAFRYAQKGAVWKYVLCCLAASTIHSAALIFIPIYWVLRTVRLDEKKSALLILSGGVISAVFPVIRPVALGLVPNQFDKYLAANSNKAEALLVGVFYAVLVALVCFAMTRKERSRVVNECSIGVTMFVLNMCLFSLTLSLKYAARGAALFGPYLIILLPQMLERIESRGRRTLVKAVVVLVCGCQYIMRLCINNIGGTMPYQFFW